MAQAQASPEVNAGPKGHPPEHSQEDAENNHGEERLQDSPGYSKHCLLVSNLDVTPRQEIQQISELPEFPQM